MKRMTAIRKVCFALVLLLVFAGLRQGKGRGATVLSPARLPDAVLVLDAGHGGEDGGAVSPSGTVESRINLEIALRVAALMDLYRAERVLLRDSDCSLHDDGCVTLREKKVSDLRNRVARIESTPNAILMSIHQNAFSDRGYHGAQVFYGAHEKSLPFARHVQSTLRDGIDPENTRVPAAIPSSVYLMNHITCPAILVECGFLTNPAEEALLKAPEYQTKIAISLASAYLTYESTEEESLYESS